MFRSLSNAVSVFLTTIWPKYAVWLYGKQMRNNQSGTYQYRFARVGLMIAYHELGRGAEARAMYNRLMNEIPRTNTPSGIMGKDLYYIALYERDALIDKHRALQTAREAARLAKASNATNVIALLRMDFPKVLVE